ncbi:hypothetical protein DSO57_1006980 [Entomophthora muscae]|uniref:Uncharacterized protein n=1 Tax=Entomophthora muscae TaxID=34485 RepID=A0ACC2UIG6_9FUNG|nr:hypothetical protein DSO57_1006980 [Entomophthora muscae]
MKEIPVVPPTQYASCPGLHIGAGQPGCAPEWELAPPSYCSQLSGLILPIVYMAFQAQPASPVGVQLDSSLNCDTVFENLKKKVP